ncbi:uncharacterized protein CANTADRAFT_8070 [Suhomyces tanzawaensis NRRL Y-17324]|uniref:Calcium-channel protein CCH1 n=1 Tax=Suhomyces tanzawaensis NRRL Y-17324 TaxID=984487 RepID=A0A1E4SDS8_9ASCO|nr:uncharacterized protein CANTADRAFT_8070 [Suhomyces tanzawaensis NRRL Y-17324]ODV77628.1 hypothetical protein CANTADRAFT_8070 [Suhomyces tanzawaensis NRRL Y-17324]
MDSDHDNSFNEDYNPHKTYQSKGHSPKGRSPRSDAAARVSLLSTSLDHHGLFPHHILPIHDSPRTLPNPDKSFIHEATEKSDFDALKEGLSFALGSGEHGAMWFPVNHDEKPTTHEKLHHSSKPTQDLSSVGHEYTDNIPLEDMGSRHSQFGGSNSDASLHLSPFADPSSKPATPSQEIPEINFDHLEAGSSKKEETSPAKFSDAITRFSERIAGTGATKPVEDSPSKKTHLTVKSRNASTAPSPISGTFLFFRDHTDEESHRKGGSTYSQSNKSVPNVTIVDENNSKIDLEFNGPSDGLGLFVSDTQPSQAESSPIIHSLHHNTSHPHFAEKTTSANMYLFGKSLKIFSPDNPIRQWCHTIISRHSTNISLLVLLFFQVILLSYRQWNPPALDGYFYKGYNWADYILMGINFIYTVEVVVKIIAYGFIDDYSMFEELGLPYPESDIKASYFKMDYLTIVLKGFGLHKILARNRRSKTGAPPLELRQSSLDDDHEDSYDVKEINLDDDSPRQHSHLRQKYRDLSLHHVDSDFDQSNLADEATPTPNIKKTNTFFIPQDKGDLSNLHLKRAYIRNSWHKIDFFSMITFWISLVLSIDHYDAKHHIMLFRTLSCLRILRLCNLTTGTSTILKSVRMAIPQLIDVSIFISFFWLFFGIIGVQSFKSSLTRHCVWQNPNDANDTYVSEQFCGSYIGLDGHAKPYIQRDGLDSLSIKGFRCPMYSRCVSGENPFGGTVSFDNILQSMELVFVVMSANTFTDIMYQTMDTDNLAACLFFICSIFILTVWLINVLIAVVVTSFDVTRENAQEEQKNKKRALGSLGFLQPKGVSDHVERMNLWKKQNLLLRYYYRFEFVFSILIGVDLFVQCFRKDVMSDARRHALYRIEAAFTLVFLAEIVLRFVLHFPNWRLFFFSKRNNFDLFLAIITSVIIFDPVKSKLGRAYYWLTVFQIMRFYRVVLATSITSSLWLKIIKNIRAIFDLALFYFILVFLMSIMMARYFEGVIPLDEFDDVDFPMHTLPNSFIALYVITSTENWTDVLYPLQQYATTTSSRSFGAVFLITWFAVSNTVILNIFIAVIAKTLEVSEEGKRKKQLLQFIDNMTDRLQNMDGRTGALSKFKSKLFKSKGVKDQLEKAVVNLLLSGTAVNDFLDEDIGDLEEDDKVKNLPSSSWKRWLHVNYWRTSNFFKNPFYSTKTRDTSVLNNFDPARFAKNIISERNVLISKQNQFLEENPYFNKVFYLMEPRHKLRRLCQRLVKSSYGERIDGVEPYKPVSESIVVIMFIATIALVVSTCYITPLFRRTIVKDGPFDWTFYLEISFVILFTLEFLIKITADGFIFTPNAYVRSSWNSIDMIVLVALWIELIAYVRNDGTLSKAVRGLKAFRALRLLTISETAKANFHNSMISGFWKIISAAIISLCLLFPFSIWGLNIFNGTLGHCLDGESSMSMCFNEYENNVFNWDVMSPNAYVQPELEFNSFAKSFLSLFQIISLEGWTDLLLDLIASTGGETPPELNSHPFNGFFVVLFNFVSTIFILTLFVSVIISNYSKTTGRAYMTHDQIAWYEVKKILIQVKPSKRKDFTQLTFVRRFCYMMTVEKNRYWSIIMNFTLFMHVLSLLLECFPTYNGLYAFRMIVYMVAATVFLINALMLLTGQGLVTFLRYKWNCFSLFISVGAFITTIIGFFINQDSVFININRLFLVSILAFIIPRSNRLSQLLRFASASLPSLLSLSFTWLVVFLVFAIAMNQIFGLTKIGPNGTGNLNLRSVPKALIVLFRCSFGEGWNYIMDDYALESPYCTVNNSIDNSDCGNKAFAYILFIAWNIVSMYIFVNMFISLILDSFNYIRSRSSYSSLIQREEIRKFKRTWQKFDSQGSGYIKPIELPKLLHALEGALSFHFYKGALEIPVLCKEWIKRNDPYNPYDIQVNYDSLKRTLDKMDIPKIRERRRAYERFMEEALLNMELNNDPGISFTRILLQLPLYTSFEAGQCLNLIDFLERRLLVQKVEKRLHTKRVYETIAAYACRWKYKQNQHKGIRTTDIAFDKELKRHSYLANENLDVNAPSIFVTDTNEETNSMRKLKSNEDDHEVRPNDFYDNEDENTPLSKSYNVDPESSTSGVYVPKSPLSIYKARNRVGSGNHLEVTKEKQPKLFIEIPNKLSRSSDSSPILTSSTFNDEDINLSPFLEQDELATHEEENKVSLIDIATVGETLENSSWGEAFREVQDDSNSWKNKDK